MISNDLQSNDEASIFSTILTPIITLGALALLFYYIIASGLLGDLLVLLVENVGGATVDVSAGALTGLWNFGKDIGTTWNPITTLRDNIKKSKYGWRSLWLI